MITNCLRRSHRPRSVGPKRAIVCFNGRNLGPKSAAGQRWNESRDPRPTFARPENAVGTTQAEIGQEWTKRVKENGYAGVSVFLAESLVFEKLYPSVYRPASGGDHATDAARFLIEDREREGEVLFSVAPFTDGIATALRLASLMLVKTVEVMDGRLGLGLGAYPNALIGEIETMRLDLSRSDAGIIGSKSRS